MCNCVSIWTSTHKRQHCCGQMLSATMSPSVWHHIPQQQLPETLWPTKFNAVLSNYMWPHGCISSCQAKRVLLTLYFMRLCQREQVPLPYCIGLVYSSVIVYCICAICLCTHLLTNVLSLGTCCALLHSPHKFQAFYKYLYSEQSDSLCNVVQQCLLDRSIP